VKYRVQAGLDSIQLVAAQRDVGGVIAVESKFRFSIFVDCNKCQGRFGSFFPNDIRQIDRFALQKCRQCVTKLVNAKLGNVGGPDSEPPDTDCDVKRRTASSFVETRAASQAEANIGGNEIEKSFAAD